LNAVRPDDAVENPCWSPAKLNDGTVWRHGARMHHSMKRSTVHGSYYVLTGR